MFIWFEVCGFVRLRLLVVYVVFLLFCCLVSGLLIAVVGGFYAVIVVAELICDCLVYCLVCDLRLCFVCV